MAVAMIKGKYMPLSEANVEPTMVSSYDGQHLCVGVNDVRYLIGNYLGGGIAGVVYEAFDKVHQRNVAIKMLNPVGYKLVSPSTLRRGEVVKKGTPILGNLRGMTRENVYWVSLPNRRDLIACYVDGRSGSAMGSSTNSGALRELTLDMCVALWRLDALDNPCWSMQRDDPVYSCRGEEMKEDEATGTARCDEEEVRVGDAVVRIPTLPAKYRAFLQSRKSIYREIAHMHKLTGNSVSGQVNGGHENVLKLYDVLEFVQSSKSTIFLVLELAGGGELFERIRSDNGVDEAVARTYFAQLLAGVLYCHQLGIVHRDLKPENLLLSDQDVLKIADFGLSAHFIAAVSSSAQDEAVRGASHPDNDEDSNILMRPARFRRLNSVVGSPHYVAPEVITSARYGYDGRKADMWSIGVILYGLLVGSLPFGKDLPTCPRFLKVCEWIRSLPSDMYTGKLIYESSVYQSNPSSTSSSTGATLPPALLGMYQSSDEDMRFSQIHPNQTLGAPSGGCAPTMTGWWHPAVTPLKGASASSCHGGPCNSQNSGIPPSGPSSGNGRRPTRVVSFPSWFFPAKLSPSAVYLLACLLHPDPARRFSCEDACKSIWVLGHEQ